MFPANDIQWTESDIQRYIAMMANRAGLLFHGDGNGVNKGKIGGMRMKLQGARKGWPDMVFILHGRIVFIELKTNKGKLSPEQIDVHDKIIANGFEAHTVYGLNGEDAWDKTMKILGV